MGDLGFWALAQEDPDYLALVTPEGDEVTAGRAAGTGQPGGARPAGPGPRGGRRGGHAAAQRRRDDRGLPGRAAGRLVPGPDQPPPGGARGGLHPRRTPGPRPSSPTSASVTWPRRRPTRWASTASGRLAVGDVPGFASYAAVRDAQPTTLPEDRTIGDVMNYTSGTTGNPKGIYRKLTGVTPEQAALGLSGLLFLFGIQPAGRQRPHHRLAALPHRGPALRERVAAPRAHGRADGQVAARGDAAADRGAPGDHVAHGADPVPPPAGAARGRAGQVRRVLAAPHDPRRRARAPSTSSTR